MKIGIIGGGASGCFLAIRLKESNPSLDVTIIERNDKLLKKILVTGNGRCNYANTGDLTDKYNNELANKLLSEFTPKDIIAAFDSYGIHPYAIDNLIYPTSLSAQTVAILLTKKIEELGINVILNESVFDYQNSGHGFFVKTGSHAYMFDKVVFSSGGCAYPQLGTDGTILNALSKHGYKIEPLSQSLSPIKVKENTKKISGQRQKGKVTLFQGNNKVYEEEGEILFKDDGLSGIVMLNISSRINRLIDYRDIKVVLDLANTTGKVSKEQYIEYVSPKIADYLIDNNLDIHNLSFTFRGFYDYQIAEVSHGGVSLDEITSSLESKKENGLYFTGEVLDIDGMCGGFNLMFAFASAEKVKNAIKE